jgi:DNA-binding transcriptional MerR regulator
MGFTAAQAARLTGTTASQIAYWARSGLVVPEGRPARYSFRDLVALRVVGALLASGLSPARVRRAIRHLLDAGEDIAGLRIITDGDRVWACRDDGEILDALAHGQLALFVAVDAYATEVSDAVATFEAERDDFVAGLRRVGS